MLETALGLGSMFTAPHRDAARVGRQVLEDGGTAMEAMVAASAMIAVVYPHMNGVGGDGFWLIHRPGRPLAGISACGCAAALAGPEWYAVRGHSRVMPTRGSLAALTVPGSVDGWRIALEMVERQSRLSIAALLAPAAAAARRGVAVTAGHSRLTRSKLAELIDAPGFADIFLVDGEAPAPGARLRQTALAETLEELGRSGLRSFYEGEVASRNAAWLEECGSPLRPADFRKFAAHAVVPLCVELREGVVHNLPAPTQGVSSLMILGIFDRLDVRLEGGFSHVHALVEATKQAFLLRDRHLGDPKSMDRDPAEWLSSPTLDVLAARVSPTRALEWPAREAAGDTIWMGAADGYGNVVSFIQSLYWEFGSGLVCPETGVLFQNRGAGFSLMPGPNQLAPGRRPFHTLNPAMAVLADGRVMAYGTMGGEGQPQTQAAVFTRHVRFGLPLQESITAPRWLLGRTWGDAGTSLKLENRFDIGVVDALRAAGHEVEIISPFSDLCGHAGAVVAHRDGLREGAADPRADGVAL